MAHLVTERGHTLAMLPSAIHPVALDGYAAWLAVPTDVDAEQTRRVLAQEGTGCDVLVVDHYGIGKAWEEQVRPGVNKIVVIDDLADRRHDCDIVTEQNYRPKATARYNNLVPDNCLRLVGPEYALLRPEFAQLRERVTERTEPRRLLVFYGGVDATNETGRAINLLRRFDSVFKHIDLVIGAANPNSENLRQQARSLANCEIHAPAGNIAELMLRADLALGAGGVTSWERCCLGLPTIITAVADNQVEIAESLDTGGAAWFAGNSEEAASHKVAYILEEILMGRKSLADVSRAAYELCDGGGAARVSSQIENITHPAEVTS